MEPTVLIIALVVFALVTGVIWFTSADRSLKRRMRQLPAAPIAEAPEGVDVRITGTLGYVGGEAPLTAPLSGRACAAWRVIVEEHRGSGNSKRWVKLVEESESRDFFLEDETGRALVDGSMLKLAVEEDSRGGTGLFDKESPEFAAFLQERGHETHGLFFKKALRYREGVLEAAEQVTVAGAGSWRDDPSQPGQGYRASGKLFHLRSLSDGQLLASDDPSVAV